MDIQSLAERFHTCGVDYVIIGGVALALHGSSYITVDIDVAYSREPANLQRLVDALKPIEPRLRAADTPEGVYLPYGLDITMLKEGMNFTLTTSLGDLDLLGQVAGFETYEQLKGRSHAVRLGRQRVDVLSLEGLLISKRAAARPKDALAIPEIEAMIEWQKRMPKNPSADSP